MRYLTRTLSKEEAGAAAEPQPTEKGLAMTLSKGDGVRKRDRRLVVDLMRQTESLTRSDLAHWRMAHQMAIDVENPQRVQLLRLYRDVELDGHLSGAVAQIRGMVKARSFMLVNADGEADDEALRMLDADWFKRVMDLWLDTRYWGFSLVQVGDPDKETKRFGWVELVPREHVCPEHGRIVRIAGDHWSAGWDWRESDYAPYLLEMGRADDLGLYLKCARYTIPKKNVEQFWDTFAEMFGMPLRIAHTSSRDEKDRRKLMSMMEQMGSAAYAVVQEGTEVDVVENSKSDAYEVYDRRIERCDRELSKLVISQTMTIEDGSSLSQSETHLDVLKNLIESIADDLRDFINGQVLPLMRRENFFDGDYSFEWDYPLDYTPEQMTAVETMLLQHFKVDRKYFEDKYGVPVREMEDGAATEPDRPKSVGAKDGEPAEKERLSKEEMERFFGYAPMAPGGGEVTLGKDDDADLAGVFRGMMKAVFEQGGAELKVSLLGDKRVQSFIDAHAQVLDSSFDEVRMSDRMRQRLQRSDWVFSGMKAFREMGEAFPSLVDENGIRKPFEQFLRDVRKIDETYNKHYLRAEYEFAAASAEMAAKWERFMEDGDRYNLQYRTAGDDRVRPEHAALNGVTLPPSDDFWESYYPPNGWRCRCTVVQVRKRKYPETPHDDAMALGEAALERDTKGMFRFNPGKQERVFPAYNAYTQERCRNCQLGGKETLGKVELSKDPKKCQACRLLQECYVKGTFDWSEFFTKLSETKGSDFVSMLKEITRSRKFTMIEEGIWGVSDKDLSKVKVRDEEEYQRLLNGARKAVEHGYQIFILPNPKDVPSADYIMLRKGIYKLADLKTVMGANSVGNRLVDSASQANRAVLNMATTYNPRRLGEAIRHYFDNPKSVEVIIFKGKREISITRENIDPKFVIGFIKRYTQ